jgi:hypothetical protein
MSKENESTMPWMDCELGKVNGHAVCYTRDDAGELIARLPGGWAASFAQLKRNGYAVEMPAELRDFSGRRGRRA